MLRPQEYVIQIIGRGRNMDLGRDRGLIPLTRTELNCLRQCAEGRTDVEIGRGLELTSGEVSAVLSVAILKLRVPNRMAGLAKAARLGFIGSPPL